MMGRYIAFIGVLAALLGGCSQKAEPPWAGPQSGSNLSALTQADVEKPATDLKQKWLNENPNEKEQVGQATIREVKKTATGWHMLFEQVRFPGEPEGESHHFLHIYIDTNGNLERVVRGPDEIA